MAEIRVPNSLGDVDGIIWYNGQLVEWREAKVHFLSHSLHYASALFEGIRVYNGRVFEAQKHLKRLKEGARTLRMHVTYSIETLSDAIDILVRAHKIKDGYVRPLVWRGPGPMDFNPRPNPPNIAIAVWPLDSFIKDDCRLLLSDYRRPSPGMGPWQTKATGLYLSATLSKARALEKGYDDALMLSWDGCIADTTGTNIFLVRKGELYTPQPDGFFAGITMQTIMKFAKKNAIKVHIQKIPVSHFSKAEEVFLTGTAAGIVPVREIRMDQTTRYKFKNSEITTALREQYINLYTQT